MQTEIERIFETPPARYTPEHFSLFSKFKQALNAGTIRAAEPDPAVQPSGWRVNAWVKKGILLGFRMGGIVDMSIDAVRQPFFDKSTYPVKHFEPRDGVRIVPGGSSIRDGCFVGRSVTCMPPMYINVGAYVGEGTSELDPGSIRRRVGAAIVDDDYFVRDPIHPQLQMQMFHSRPDTPDFITGGNHYAQQTKRRLVLYVGSFHFTPQRSSHSGLSFT